MIEVGEYVRTHNGEIMKVTDIPVKILGEVTYQTDYQGYVVFEEEVKSHSKNIIDLIEVGDIIYYSIKDWEDVEWIGIIRHKNIADEQLVVQGFNGFTDIEKINILSILTHEQYERICYRLED